MRGRAFGMARLRLLRRMRLGGPVRRCAHVQVCTCAHAHVQHVPEEEKGVCVGVQRRVVCWCDTASVVWTTDTASGACTSVTASGVWRSDAVDGVRKQ